jgi:hypothetical protein
VNYADPQFSDGSARADQHEPNQVEGVHGTNVKSLRWVSPRGRDYDCTVEGIAMPVRSSNVTDFVYLIPSPNLQIT